MQRKEQLKTEVIPTNEEEAEEFAKAIMQRAASLKVAKINRGDFLRSEIKRRFPEIDADFAVETTPAETGIAPEDLDRMAIDVIDLETKKCAGLSFLAGIPGGLAMVGTVPADLAQYFAHVMRIEQKLAYIYGWQTFLNEEDEVDDETVMKLVVLMGVMMQVGGAANAVTTFAANTARAGIEKAIQKQALDQNLLVQPHEKGLALPWRQPHEADICQDREQGGSRYWRRDLRRHDLHGIQTRRRALASLSALTAHVRNR